MAKDLGLATATAQEVGCKSPFTSQALHVYMEMCENGYDSKDFSCVFQHYYSGTSEA